MFNLKKYNQRQLAITVILTVGIIALANFFAWRFSRRFDLTENKAFSISSYSQQLVRTLPDVVTVKAYFSKDMPPQFSVIREQASDLLNEYASYGGNLRVKYVDPGDGKEAESAGIPKLQFNDVRRDKLEVASGYFGLNITYRGKTELIPMVDDVSILEYQLTSALKKLSAPQLPAIGWVAGYGGTADSYGASRQALAKIYGVQDVSLRKPADLAAATSLLIADPTKDFSKADTAALDTYLAKGRNIIVLYDKFHTGQGGAPEPNPGNLSAWLAGHGLKLGEALVLDNSSGAATFNQGYLSYSLAYPYWPKLSRANFNDERPIFAKLEGVILPWVTAIDIGKASSTQVLASSSGQAWLAQGSFVLSPDKIPAPSQGFSRYPLAAEAKSGKGKIILVADADFARDQYVSSNPANLVFFQDLVDSAMQEDGLSAIRAKNIASHPIRDISEKTKNIIRYANVFGLPILVIIAGALVFLSRRRTKNLEC